MHRTTELSGTGKVLKFSQRAAGRPEPKKGLNLLMIHTESGREDFHLVLLHEEVRWLRGWLERGTVGYFPLCDPAMQTGRLQKMENGKIGFFKEKDTAVFAWTEPLTLQQLLMQHEIEGTYQGALLLQRMGQQDYM